MHHIPVGFSIFLRKISMQIVTPYAIVVAYGTQKMVEKSHRKNFQIMLVQDYLLKD